MAYIDEIEVGGTVYDLQSKSVYALGNAIINGWNQLADVSTATGTTSGITWSNDGKSVTATGTATTNAYRMLYGGTVVGHKYALIGGNQHIRLWHNGTPNNYEAADRILAVTASGNIYVRVSSGVTVFGETITPRVHDLTEIFGAGNEPSIEQFRQLFPDDYYPYATPGFGDLLWENASMGDDFALQTIPIDLSCYAFVRVYAKVSKSAGQHVFSDAIVNEGTTFNATLFSPDGSNRMSYRSFRASSTGVRIEDAYYYPTYATNSGRTTGNATLIPYRIYGIR